MVKESSHFNIYSKYVRVHQVRQDENTLHTRNCDSVLDCNRVMPRLVSWLPHGSHYSWLRVLRMVVSRVSLHGVMTHE